MSENAFVYSTGAGPYSAIKAHELSLSGDLTDPRDFECCGCHIRLTCTNWGREDARRVYYTPQNRKQLHRENCSEITPMGNERSNNALEAEKDSVLRDVRRGQLILKMTKNPPKGYYDVDGISGRSRNNVSHRNKTRNHSGGEKRHISSKTHCYSIETYVDLFVENKYDHLLVEIDREIIPLGELFVDINNLRDVHYNKNRIFYGKANMEKHEKGYVEFVFSRDKVIPTNYYSLIRNKCYTRTKSGKIAKQMYENTDMECTLFFRGSYNGSTFRKYSSAFYNDIALRTMIR